MAPNSAPADWYRDPIRKYSYRYWNGTRWTEYVGVAGRTVVDPIGSVDLTGERTHLEYVEQFLDDARAAATMAAPTHEALRQRVADRRDALVELELGPVVHEAVTGADGELVAAPTTTPVTAVPSVDRTAIEHGPVPAPPTATSPTMTSPFSTPVATPAAPAASPVATTAPRPETRFDRAWKKIEADLAIHWLAYLGVLMVFAGVFGFVAFAFSEVRAGLRPVAEIAIPLAMFGAAAFLNRQRAPHAGRVMEALGGALLPVVVIASLNDGASPPPDPSGAARWWIAAAACWATAAVMVWVSSRRDSPLRYIAGPTAWLGAGMAGALTRVPIPTGSKVASIGGWQPAVIAVSIAATVAVLRVLQPSPQRDATEAAAIPAAAVAVLLAALAGSTNGWSVGPAALTGLAALLTVQLLHERLPAMVRVVIDIALVAGSVAALTPRVSFAWQGVLAAVALVVLVEVEAPRCAAAREHGPDATGIEALSDELVLLLVALTTALAVGSLSPVPAMAAWGAATLWLNARRLRVAEWLPVSASIDTAAGLAPLGVAAGAFARWAAPPVLFGCALATLGFAAFIRKSNRVDRMWAAWVPSVSGAIVAGSAFLAEMPAHRAADDRWYLAAGCGAATLALAVSALSRVARIWAVAAGTLATLTIAFAASGAAVPSWSLAYAGLGLLLVIAALVPRLGDDRGHLGLVGHLTGLAAVAVAETSWQSTVVVAAALVGWALTACERERATSLVVETAQRSLHAQGRFAAAIAAAPMVIAIIGTPAFVSDSFDNFGWLRVDDRWFGLVEAGFAVLYTGLSRLVRSRQGPYFWFSRVAFWIAFLNAVFIEDRGPALVYCSVLVAVVVALGAERPWYTVWAGWLGFLGVVASGSDIAGLHGYRISMIVGGAAALALLATLGRDRAQHRRLRARLSKDGVAPVVVTAGAICASIIGAATAGAAVFGWWMIAVATWAATVAVITGFGAMTTLTACALPIGVVALTRIEPFEHPWWFVVIAAALAIVSGAVERWQRARATTWWRRFDLPAFGVAHLAIGLGIAVAQPAHSFVVTWVPAGVLLAAIGIRIRRVEWQVAGAVLTFCGVMAAGPAWRVAALAVLAVGATIVAARLAPPYGQLVALGAASAGAGAWTQLVLWQPWPPRTVYVSSAVVAASFVVFAAVVTRRRPACLEWTLPWALVATSGLAAVAVAVAADNDAGRGLPSFTVAAALAIVTVAAIACIPALDAPWIRDASAPTVAVGIAFALWGSNATARTVTIAAAATIVVMLDADVVARRTGANAWSRPALVLLSIATTAMAAASVATENRTFMVLALLVAAVEAAAIGVEHSVVPLTMATPLLLAAAWTVSVPESLRGNPQWFTVPIGIALLAVTEIDRFDRHRHDQRVRSPLITMIELAGMALVVGTALMQIATTTLASALLAVVIGSLLTVWGALTHVRLRAAFGVGAATLALLMVIVVPITRSAPHWSGGTLWIVLASAGFVAIVVASLLERGIRTVRAGVARVSTLTADWE